MKKVNNMSDLFDRLNDLKIVFRYGQRLIPIIQSIIDFMKETVPLLEEINTSISDSTSKIPKAKDQITNVSSATELATTEILDIVDLISIDLEDIDKKILSHQADETKKEQIWNELKRIIEDNADAADLVNKYEAIESSSSALTNLSEKVNKIKNDVYNITLSLQVQDITSQQLAAVNHLIESVRQKLASLVMHLDETEINELASAKISVPENAAFDPDASYTRSTERQDAADVLVNDNLNKASQDEIDKLFS